MMTKMQIEYLDKWYARKNAERAAKGLPPVPRLTELSEAEITLFKETLRQVTFSPALPLHVIDQLEAQHRDKK
jgi:hypothetical protein